MASMQLDRNYHMSKKELFPSDINDGTILYATDENYLYLDFQGERRIINEKPYWDILEEPNDWEEVVNNNNYYNDYYVGMTKSIYLDKFGTHTAVLAATDTDEKADGSGTARMTWIIDIIYMDSMNDYESSDWSTCKLRSKLNSDEILSMFPKSLQQNIVEVKKTYSTQSYTYADGMSELITNTCNDRLWIPSVREVFEEGYVAKYGSDSYNAFSMEDSGPTYTYLFNTDRSRRMFYGDDFYPREWFLRSYLLNNGRYCYRTVSTGGTFDYSQCTATNGIVVGFCI